MAFSEGTCSTQLYPTDRRSTPSNSRSSSTQQDGRDGDMQLINEARTKVLLYGVGPSANAHIHPAGGLARSIQRFVNAARDEMERGITFHLNGRARVMSQDEDWNMVWRVVPPPPFPVHVRPGSANRSEHIPSENPCTDVPEAPRGEVVIDPRSAAVGAKDDPLECARRKRPLVQLSPARTKRIIDVLVRTSAVSVK